MSVIHNQEEQESKCRRNTERDEDDDEDKDKNISINIYRFKFTQEFMDEIHKFAKVHQYDDRHIFKEAWTIWLEVNNELVEGEMKRLENIGYEGDIVDKMFKSARYYFKKKSSLKKDPIARRQYISVQKEFLDAMDKHISTCLRQREQEYKPSDGFADFCKHNTDILKNEISRLLESNITDNNMIKNKIKKTYKNRYFMLMATINK